MGDAAVEASQGPLVQPRDAVVKRPGRTCAGVPYCRLARWRSTAPNAGYVTTAASSRDRRQARNTDRAADRDRREEAGVSGHRHDQNPYLTLCSPAPSSSVTSQGASTLRAWC